MTVSAPAVSSVPYFDNEGLKKFVADSNAAGTIKSVTKLTFDKYRKENGILADLSSGDIVAFDNNLEFCVVRAFEVVTESGRHVVSLTYTPGKGLGICCDDNWILGNAVKVENRDVLAGSSVKTFLGKLRLRGDSMTLAQAAIKSRSAASDVETTTCGFWGSVNRSGWSKGCKHCKALETGMDFEAQLANFEASALTFLDKMQKDMGGTAPIPLTSTAASKPASGSASTAATATAASAPVKKPLPIWARGKDPELAEILPDAFKTPFWLVGEAGSGKTTLGRQVAENEKCKCIVIGGNSDVRPTDFTGHWVKTATGMVWKDGPFTRAIRLAQTEKVVLIIDEMMRIEPENLSVLFTSLVPYKGRYHHATGRMVDEKDGLGTEEELSCPVENLAIFATGNLGAQHGVVDRDPALRRRFREVEMHVTADKVKRVCYFQLEESGFSNSEEVAVKLAALYEKMKKAKDEGLLDQAPNLGIFCRCIEMANKTVTGLKSQLHKEVLQFVGYSIDGYSNKTQIKSAKDLISTIL